jgi:hypothetical protein
MGEELREVGVDLLEGGQQARAPLRLSDAIPLRSLAIAASRSSFSCTRVSCSSCTAARVFLGAQVHRAQRVALTPETVDIGLHPVGARKRIGQIAQALAQILRRGFEFLRDARGGGLHGLARGIAPGLGGGTGFARFGCGAFRGAFTRDGLCSSRVPPRQAHPRPSPGALRHR